VHVVNKVVYISVLYFTIYVVILIMPNSPISRQNATIHGGRSHSWIFRIP